MLHFVLLAMIIMEIPIIQMHLPQVFQFLGLAFFAAVAQGATLQLAFVPDQGAGVDPLYPSDSTVSTGTANYAGVVPTLTGRGYGVEQTSNVRSGIVAGPLAWQPAKSGWTIRNGFAPDAIGSTVSNSTGEEVAASYLSLSLSGLPTGTIFQGVTLSFNEVTYLRPTNAWAGTSADGFATATRVTYSNTGGSRSLGVTLPDFSLQGLGPLEIRIFGVIGSDEGAFNFLNVTAEMVTPMVAPEPDLRYLLTVVAIGGVTAFRRRSGMVPR